MNCERCGKAFEATRTSGKPKRFCSETCRSAEEKRRSKRRVREHREAQYTKETGLHPSKGRCPTCGVVFERYSDFENRQGWRKFCSTECQKKNEASKERYQKVQPSPRDCIQCGTSFVSLKGKLCSDACREARRQEKSFRGHPITKEEFHAMEEAQGGCCKICKQAKPLVIDHCHSEGHVRGLLCMQCNSGLGMFRDNIAYLSEAIGYLSINPSTNRVP